MDENWPKEVHADRLSMVPEVFYDLIARVVPGTLLALLVTFTVPGWREQVAGVLQGPKGFVPTLLIVLPGVVCVWSAGFLLSVGSSWIETVFMAGWNPSRHSLCGLRSKGVCWLHPIDRKAAERCSPDRLASRAMRLVECLCGLPVSLIVRRRLLYSTFDERTASAIRDRIEHICGTDYVRAPFWLCFDYARTLGAGPAGSAVVKAVAEATCARSLILVFLVTGVLTLWLRDNLLGWVLIGLAALSCTAFSYYRVQARHRLLLTLLLCGPRGAGVPTATRGTGRTKLGHGLSEDRG